MRVKLGETTQTGTTRAPGISQPFLGRIGSNCQDIKYMYIIFLGEVARGVCLWLLRLWLEHIWLNRGAATVISRYKHTVGTGDNMLMANICL